MQKKNRDSLKRLYRLLTPGIKMTARIEFGPDDSYQMHSTLIGHKADKYILLDFPKSAMEALIVRSLTNVSITIRGICDTGLGHIVAFKTSIVQSIKSPFPMLVVRMPHHFATKPIREHCRYKVSIPATVSNERKILEGTVVDFSASGCAILVNSEHHLSKDNALSIKSALDNYFNAPPTIEVANITSQEDGQLIGIRFGEVIDINEQLKSILFDSSMDINT